MRLAILKENYNDEVIIAEVNEVNNFGVGDLVIFRHALMEAFATEMNGDIPFAIGEVKMICDFDTEEQVEFLEYASGIENCEFCEIVGVVDKCN